MWKYLKFADLCGVSACGSSIRLTRCKSFGSQALDTEIVVHVPPWVALLAVALASAHYSCTLVGSAMDWFPSKFGSAPWTLVWGGRLSSGTLNHPTRPVDSLTLLLGFLLVRHHLHRRRFRLLSRYHNHRRQGTWKWITSSWVSVAMHSMVKRGEWISVRNLLSLRETRLYFDIGILPIHCSRKLFNFPLKEGMAQWTQDMVIYTL